MVTFDTDYLALHQTGPPHEAIVWCPATKHSIGELIGSCAFMHGVMDCDTMRNHVEYL